MEHLHQSDLQQHYCGCGKVDYAEGETCHTPNHLGAAMTDAQERARGILKDLSLRWAISGKKEGT